MGKCPKPPRATHARQAIVIIQGMPVGLAMYVRQTPYFTGATSGPTVNGSSDWIHSL